MTHQRNSSTAPYVWQLLGMAAYDIEASARAEICADNALDMALRAGLPTVLAAVDLALSFEQSRRVALDTWLATVPAIA